MKALRYFVALIVIAVVIAPMCIALAIYNAVQEFEKWDGA